MPVTRQIKGDMCMASRNQRLARIIDDLQEFPSVISDDSDEQTAMIESYRYLVIHLKALSRGLIPKEIEETVEKIDDDFEDIYDVYRAKAYVDVILPDIGEVLQNLKIERSSFAKLTRTQSNIDIKQNMQRVFLSHSDSDSGIVKYLAEHLNQVFPSLSFFVSSSYESLRPGDDWWDKIRGNLEDAKVILACVSRLSINRPWILFESGFGLGHKAILIPIILDDLPISELGPPLSMFQVIRLDDSKGLMHLIYRISQATGTQVEDDLIDKQIPSLNRDLFASIDTSTGFYVGSAKIDIASGWQRYHGDLNTLKTQKGYLSIGNSFDDAFQYPPEDTLKAPWQYWGFRIRRTFDVHIYAVVRLIDGTNRKIYASSNLNSWGFTGDPIDEFRVPLGKLPKNKWQVVIINTRSLEHEFESPIQAIIGVRVRGPLHISHVWCVEDIEQIPAEFNSEAKVISYPRHI